MSERGQKIFKIITWVVILVLVLFKIFTLGQDVITKNASLGFKNENQAEAFSNELNTNELENLSADSTGVLIGQTTQVTVTVYANAQDNAVELYCNDELVGEMCDSGQDGDALEADGCYTSIVEITPENDGEEFTYIAKCASNYSNEIKVIAFDAPNEQDYENANIIINSANEAGDNYLTDGYVKESDFDNCKQDVISSIQESAEENGIGIIEISETEDGVYLMLDSGVQYVYQIKKENEEEGDDAVSLSVGLIEPYLTSGSTELASLASFDDSAELIDKTLDDANFTKNYSDDQVTIDHILEVFQPNSFIIWHGHGGYSEKTGSFLGTGLESTQDIQSQYSDDLVAGRMILTGDGRIAINYTFFNKYVGDLSNSFVYLGGCHTGQDRKLLSVMQWKNAAVSLGFTDTVLTKYDCNIMKTLTEQLCTLDEETGKYIPMNKALGYCKKKYGNDDGDDTPAEPIYMGEETYRIDDIFQDNDTDSGTEIPDLDDVGQDIKDDVDNKIEEKKNAIADEIASKIEAMIEQWFDENCGGC